MERRYDRLAAAGVRNIVDYNERLASGRLKSTPEAIRTRKMPYLIVVIDELADLMITAAREVEEPIARLAQLARAVGIHLIVATQRPSVDVITGVIKANFPARIAYQVASKTDSRTILDMNGAEQLLGNGDMLYLAEREPETRPPAERVHLRRRSGRDRGSHRRPAGYSAAVHAPVDRRAEEGRRGWRGRRRTGRAVRRGGPADCAAPAGIGRRCCSGG